MPGHAWRQDGSWVPPLGTYYPRKDEEPEEDQEQVDDESDTSGEETD